MKNWMERTILKTTRKQGWGIHGGYALMHQLPPRLRRKTDDIDLWSRTPKPSSKLLHTVLEKHDPGDQFSQNKMKLGGYGNRTVYRIVDRTTQKTVADFTPFPNDRNLYTVIGGIKWETLEHAKYRYKVILSNPDLKSRHAKAQGDLNRILRFENELKFGRVSKRTIDDLINLFRFSKLSPRRC